MTEFILGFVTVLVTFATGFLLGYDRGYRDHRYGTTETDY